MRKLFIILFFGFVMLFSGCSGGTGNLLGGGGSKVNYKTVDITGKGLRVSFDIDDEWASQKKVDYYLTLENTGQDEIRLTRENFELFTYESINGNENVFTQDSIEGFYSNLFRDSGEIVLPQNAEVGVISGRLDIEDWFYEGEIDQFEYVLQVEYPYTTRFSNNILITRGDREPLKVTDKLSQAAPIQIVDVEMIPYDNEDYYVAFTIANKGDFSITDEFFVQLNSFDFSLGGTQLNDCVGYYEDGDKKVRIDLDSMGLSKDRPRVVYACIVSIADYDVGLGTTSSVSGSFEYVYWDYTKDVINLPANRNQDFWN